MQIKKEMEAGSPTEASSCASILTLTISINIRAISDHIIVGLKSKWIHNDYSKQHDTVKGRSDLKNSPFIS